MVARFALSRIHLLVFGHLLVGLSACAYAAFEGQVPFVLSYLPIVPHLAMIVSQACLLAIWAVLGTSDAGVRATCFGAGVVYLEALLYLGAKDDDFFGLASFSALAVAAVLLFSRIWLGPLVRHDGEALTAAPPTFQFSIKGLMLLMFGVALSITVAKIVNAFLGGPRLLVELMLWVAAVATTGLTAAWAMLTKAGPAPRAALVVLLSLGSAALVALGFNEGWEAYFYLITITALQAVLVLASLLVVRSCGYRLTRKSMRRNPSATAH